MSPKKKASVRTTNEKRIPARRIAPSLRNAILQDHPCKTIPERPSCKTIPERPLIQHEVQHTCSAWSPPGIRYHSDREPKVRFVSIRISYEYPTQNETVLLRVIVEKPHRSHVLPHEAKKSANYSSIVTRDANDLGSCLPP